MTDNIKKAELLNKQFKSVFTQEDTDHLPQITKPKFSCMPEIHVNVNGVQKLLSELNIHKATGPDEIPSRILKDYANEIAPALTVIFRKSLSRNCPGVGVKPTSRPFSKKVNVPKHLIIDLFH